MCKLNYFDRLFDSYTEAQIPPRGHNYFDSYTKA
jgi:hypothetical protein